MTDLISRDAAIAVVCAAGLRSFKAMEITDTICALPAAIDVGEVELLRASEHGLYGRLETCRQDEAKLKSRIAELEGERDALVERIDHQAEMIRRADEIFKRHQLAGGLADDIADAVKAASPKGEPVAWRIEDRTHPGWWTYYDTEQEPPLGASPLYAHPAPTSAMVNAAPRALPAASDAFQARVDPWLQSCFGNEIARDRLERGDRLLEEVLELLQAGAYPRDRIASLARYVWSRPAGEPAQEAGGVMVTLAAYCLAHGLDMHAAGEAELSRVWTKVEKIRAKQAAKPAGSALPMEWPHPASAGVTVKSNVELNARAAMSAWLDEVEGFATRRERLSDELDYVKAVPWLMSAFSVGILAALERP